MSELEELLQERLEQLEDGAPLEICLKGLPEQEARALRLIATIRDVPIDDVDVERISGQRAGILAAATERLGPAADPRAVSNVSLLARLQLWLDWLLTRRELAVGLASLLIIAILGVAWLGLTSGRNRGEAGVVVSTAGEAAEMAAQEPAAVSAVTENTGSEEEMSAGESAADAAVAETAATSLAHTAFIPVMAHPLNLDPQTAAVEDVQGLVEIQGEDGEWSVVNGAGPITAGQRVRTGDLSRATLTFYDNSQATLSANTEVSIDELNAQRPEAGFRTVILTQHVGESDHSVQFRNDGGSRYEVKTPAGSGIARGTKFHVLVTPDLLARFAVSEGEVEVTALSQTVSVIPGQLTTVFAGRVPDAPAFRITGEGEVSQIGSVWTIGGQTFQTHDLTIIIGNPQVGDLVSVEGHLSSTGERVADRIILLRRDLANRFTLTGPVQAMGTTSWTVAGQIILTDENSLIDDHISVGETVRIEGMILPGGALLALEIELVDDLPGLPFRFTGIVQAIGDGAWTISNHAIKIDEETDIDDDIIAGDVVAVSGWILNDGAWLARHIEQAEDDNDLVEFSFTGHVQGVDPWLVAGIAFETREWTVIEPGIVAGDLVRVSGVILEDGTWVAATIGRLNDEHNNTIVLIGVVDSINPWVVNGQPLLVTGETLIVGNIAAGDLVIVEIQLLPDGTWQVLSIKPLYPRFGIGCFLINTVVLGVQPNQLRLKHWPAVSLDDEIEIEGHIRADSVISLPICIQFDGTIIIFGNIIVIYQPVIVIAPPPAPHGGNDNHNG